MINNIDLFSGIGGFSYALHGHVRTIMYSDISDLCKTTLESLMRRGLIDTAPIVGDIRNISAASIIKQTQCLPNMITAGFPCQDLSSANSRGKGLDGERSGLFYEIVRLCREMPSIENLLLENVGKIATKSNINRIKDAFVPLGFDVSHVIVSAMQIGAPHMRRRCYILVTKDMSKMKMIHPSYTDIWETQCVESMTKVKSMSETHVLKERCCLCGNSVVPACVVSAFNYLVHGTPMVEIRRDFNITLHDQTNGIMVKRKRWGTPYASMHLYNKYNSLTKRSMTVLYNQIYYQEDNTEKRTDEWTINPCFVEWMMGYPPDYTKT